MNTVSTVHEIDEVQRSSSSRRPVQRLTQRTRLHRNAPAIALLLVAVAACIAAYPVYSTFYATTNDAQVDGHILPVNSRVNGTVVWVNPGAEDTRAVSAGSVLVRLDPDDYTPSVDRLEGQVQNQQAQLNAAQLDVQVTTPAAQSRLGAAKAAVAESEADLASSTSDAQSKEALQAQARANWELAEVNRKRYEALVSTREISRSEYDQRATEATTAREQMAVAAAELKAAQTRIEAIRQRLAQRKQELLAANVVPQTIATAQSRVGQVAGQLKESDALLRQARLDLGYTTIAAPVNGIVGARQVEPGQRVQTGQLLMTIVPTDNLWVTCFFKETQLRRIRVGQPATIKVDTYGYKLRAHVESIGGATAAKFSQLPPENSTGNFVKVVQRVPVRLHVDEQPGTGQPLLPGMSVEASVQLR